jgi:hypothetical protein
MEVDAAKAWLLSYNEDGTTAMAKIRDGMRCVDTQFIGHSNSG